MTSRRSDTTWLWSFRLTSIVARSFVSGSDAKAASYNDVRVVGSSFCPSQCYQGRHCCPSPRRVSTKPLFGERRYREISTRTTKLFLVWPAEPRGRLSIISKFRRRIGSKNAVKNVENPCHESHLGTKLFSFRRQHSLFNHNYQGAQFWQM